MRHNPDYKRKSRRNSLGKRFLRDRPALAGGIALAILAMVSVITLPLSLRWYNVQALEHAVRKAPSLRPLVPLEYFTQRPPNARAALNERSRSLMRKDEGADTRHRVPHASSERLGRIGHRASSWLGHDDLGRSLLYRLLPGFLVSAIIGLAAATIATVVGTAWGAVAAWFGGRVDAVLMRIVDVLYGLPYILMVILLKVAATRPLTALFGGHSAYADLVILLLAIGGVSWLTMARVIRGQVLSLRNQPFIEAARVAGAGPLRILIRHMLPNLVGPIAVYATLVVPQAILQESFLSFLGIGVQQPLPSLGRLAADGVEAVNAFVGFWWLLVFPCTLLVITLLALNFVGDGLRDALDPKASAKTLV